MKKIGFAIKVTSQGAQEPTPWNNGPWTNKVVDVREYLKYFDGLQDHVTFMSFDESGCFITILRPIPGRQGDCVSGWIYIPQSIDISAEDVVEAYNYVLNLLSQTQFDRNSIESFFAKEYPTSALNVPYRASQGTRFAYRTFGVGSKYTLQDVIGKNRFQLYYSKYKAIFLVDETDNVTINKENGSNFDDLSDKKMEEYVALLPPSKNDIDSLGSEVEVYIRIRHQQKDTAFKNPIWVALPCEPTFVFKREGFEDISYSIEILQNGQNISWGEMEFTWQRRISSSFFVVRDEDNGEIRGAKIKINNKPLTQEILLTEEECKKAIVEISAEGYELLRKEINILNLTRCTIKLQRKSQTFSYNVELCNGKTCEMSLTSKYLKSQDDSPLKAYSFEESQFGGSGRVLRLSEWFVWKQRLWGFLSAIALAVVVGICMSVAYLFDTYKITLLPPKVEPKEKVSDAASTYASSESEEPQQLVDEDPAIAYMNENEEWNKASLEQFEITKSLFDEMNKYEFSKIAQRTIENCPRFDEVKETANKFLDEKIGGTYNNDNDNIITVASWIDNVNNKVEKSKNSKIYVKDKEIEKKKDGGKLDVNVKEKSETSETKEDISTKVENEEEKQGEGQ